jgi:hypothetical protein
MQHEPDYGTRLTDAEYMRQIVELHRGRPAVLPKEQTDDLERRELDLRIDYRLGRNFPADRRAALWVVQQRLGRQWLWPFVAHLLRGIVPRAAARTARFIARGTVDEYSKVLSESEIARFLDLGMGESPALPLDKEE